MLTKQENTRLSKFFSFTLRHGAQELNLELNKEGWLSVELLCAKAIEYKYKCNQEIVEHIVATNEKKRFQLSECGQFIRAVQGHSDTIVNRTFESVTPPETLFHGTAVQFVESIMATGLNKRGRQHVHLSGDLKTASAVGSRHGKLVLLSIDSGQMFREGIQFFLSENNVWLTESVEPKFIKVIE